MAMKNLSVEEMVAVSQAWVNAENPAHQALKKTRRLAPLLPDLMRAHAAIHKVVPRADNPRRAEISRLAEEQDATHDLLASGIYGALTEIAALDDQGAELIELRDTLFSGGLAGVIRASYRGEAGYADLLRQRLTPELRKQLKGIPLRSGNMLERVDAWLAAGERLGTLEEERARLEGESGASLGTQTVQARNGWIRTVNALLGMAELSELDEGADRLVFGPLRDAEARADARTARRKAGNTGTEVPSQGTGGSDAA